MLSEPCMGVDNRTAFLHSVMPCLPLINFVLMCGLSVCLFVIILKMGHLMRVFTYCWCRKNG